MVTPGLKWHPLIAPMGFDPGADTVGFADVDDFHARTQGVEAAHTERFAPLVRFMVVGVT